MTFPDTKFEDAGAFAAAYWDRLRDATQTVDLDAVRAVATRLADVYRRDAVLYACGNGGSAAISDSFVCDHAKLIQTDTDMVPRVVSLPANTPMMTAIGNDLSYDDVFVYQLRTLARKGDALLCVSASGDSENVVRAARWALEQEMDVIALTGFAGGRMRDLATLSIHVEADNYGVIEDVHQSLMHLLAQYIRQSLMDEALIRERKF